MKSDIYREAIDTFGPGAQLRKLVEECLELALATTHYLDGKTTREQVIEEATDVSIMIRQLQEIFGANVLCWSEIHSAKLAKLQGAIEKAKNAQHRFCGVQFTENRAVEDGTALVFSGGKCVAKIIGLEKAKDK